MKNTRRLSGAGTYWPTDSATPSVISLRSPSDGHDHRTRRSVEYTQRFEAGCTLASSIAPSGVNSGEA